MRSLFKKSKLFILESAKRSKFEISPNQYLMSTQVASKHTLFHQESFWQLQTQKTPNICLV